MNKPSLEYKKKAFEHLSKNRFATLSYLVDKKTPSSSAIYYAVDKDFNFYFTTREICRKYKALQKNKRVSLSYADEKKGITIQVEGTAEEVKSRRKNTKPIKLLSAVLAQNFWKVPPLMSIVDGEIAIYKLCPTWLRYMEFKTWEGVSFEMKF